MLGPTPSQISQAVFETLLYSDVFDFPLTSHEIHRYLSGKAATYEDVYRALISHPKILRKDQYFYLVGREEIVSIREKREIRSQKFMPHALTYGRLIGGLPFVRMAALTGSLAVNNVSGDEDFDYFLVTYPGRLWTARAFVLLFGRYARLRGHTICPNVIVSENFLAWGQHDLFAAREICQMIPIAGLGVYRKLINRNPWVQDFLPNAYTEMNTVSLKEKQKQGRKLQAILEFPLRGHLGDHIERWEMNRKIERFSKQKGFGEETVFNAEICQGNFDHHRRWTRQEFGKRGGFLSKKSASETDNVDMRTV